MNLNGIYLTDKVIPRQLFEVPIQAAIGRRIIARDTLSAVRADVTAGLYGGMEICTSVFGRKCPDCYLNNKQVTMNGR